MNEMRRLDEAAALAAVDDLDAAWAAVPWLGASIAADAASGLFARWWRSTIVDENVGAPVLPRAVFDRLHDEAGEPAAWPVGNAGLLHVYGYLLSTTPTPYGLKRERWTGPDLARAYGLAPDAFLPGDPAVGADPGPTLLARVTDAASGLLRSPAVTYDELDGAFTVALSASTGPAALVYARRTAAGPRLVTTFPVADAPAFTLPPASPVSAPRWNAVD